MRRAHDSRVAHQHTAELEGNLGHLKHLHDAQYHAEFKEDATDLAKALHAVSERQEQISYDPGETYERSLSDSPNQHYRARRNDDIMSMSKRGLDWVKHLFFFGVRFGWIWGLTRA